MKINVICENLLPDSCKEIVVEAEGKDYLLLAYILEGLEGSCYYSAVKSKKNNLRITCMKDFVDNLGSILRKLELSDF